MTNSRNQRISKLLLTTPTEVERQMATLVIERICADMADHYDKFYANEGPGVLVYMPQADPESSAFYLALPALLQAQADAKKEEQDGPAEVLRKAIVQAEALVPGKSALYIIQDDKEMRLIHYKREEERSPLAL